jgi:hypothetical protein
MTDLLKTAIDAHGGLERWSRNQSVFVKASIGGAIWAVKSQVDALKNVEIIAQTRWEHLVMDFPGQDKRTVFEPHHISVETAKGELIDGRDNPELSFEGQLLETPWDTIHVAYFSGESLWTYLNVPFLFAQEGFRSEEIASINVDGEICRRLQVTFPDHIKSHHRTQYFCFAANGLLRRHDYSVDVLGGATGLNYASDYCDVDGIRFPTTRRVVAYQGDFEPVPEPVLVTIRFRDFRLIPG